MIDLLLRLLACLLPPLARDRYLEEWRADIAGAPEHRRDVLLGALVLSATLDRGLPAHSGEPRFLRPRRLARRGLGLLTAAAVVLIGIYLTGGGIVPEGASEGVLAALQATGRTLTVLAIVTALVGAAYLAGAARAAATRTARISLLAAIAGPAMVVVGVLVPGAPWWLPLLGFTVVFAGLATGIAVTGGTRPIAVEHRTAPRRQRVPVAVGSAVLVVAVIVVGGIDLIVWNPLSKVPGTDLATIYALMAERDGFSLTGTLVATAIWAVFWSVPALLVAGLAVHRAGANLTPRRLVIVMLSLVGAAIFCRFFTGFGIGMSIADSFSTNGGDGSIVSAVLPSVGQLALAGAAIALGWAPRVQSRPVESAAVA
ncbi:MULTISPECIES: hypothetical protein [unclassified Rathayibacter]|uniref:hypothetical protein n=1 Tax=unclassified Rathayibacter TaxID=2609250 RepID=UPI0006F964E9|nr:MULTISPECIES: hypothetical protein [unclassified Rathayibacter]KQQ03631.1 hypothetical protein ASF42_09040 [Rathayibacter sp. Leaf294]KQS12087.1 hypothetical protein ASG06_09040 [Rathayibacter sp. Leaf185]